MKTLYESLLDDFEKLEDSINPIDEIKKFLKDNYLDSDKLKISETLNKDGLYEVDCKRYQVIEINNDKITSLTNGMFEFVNVENFYCSYCDNLTSLEGAPKEVKGYFVCSDCKNLTTIEGAPKKCKFFNCSWCPKLTSLEGAPKEVKEFFDCSYCNKLTSLKGAPKKIRGVFNCTNCKNLTSLEGAPENVNNFNCSYCNKLTSFKGAPKKIYGDLICTNCKNLTSLEGAPKLTENGNFKGIGSGLAGRYDYDSIMNICGTNNIYV